MSACRGGHLAAAERSQQKLSTTTKPAAARRLVRAAQVAAELVELRREELQRVEALMKGVPASVEHRGRRTHRPMPQPGSIV
jgi:hypothetical protein